MKIISLAPSNTEILYALEVEEDLVATTSLCDYPEEAIEKQNLGGWSEGLNVEKVVEIDPEVALASDSLQDEAVEKLEERGVNVRQFTPTTLEEVFDSIREIGEIVEKNERAKELVEEMRTGLSELSVDKTKIYCEEWTDPPMVSGNWIPGIIREMNGDYFIQEGERSREFELEKLRQFDPEYIFLNVCGAGENIDVDRLKTRDGWEELTAVRKDDVYVINDALLNRPGPRLVEGAEKMAEKI